MSEAETSIVEDMEVIKELIRESFPDYLPKKKLDTVKLGARIEEEEE